MSENSQANLISSEALEMVMGKVKDVVDPIVKENKKLLDRVEELESQVEQLEGRVDELYS